MKIESCKDSNGIKTECPNKMGCTMFNEFMVFLVGGWNCINCKHYIGIDSVSDDGNKAVISCNFKAVQ